MFNFCLTIDSVLRGADSSICITNQLKQLQVREFCDERAMFTNDQHCPVLNIKIEVSNNNYKFKNHFMFSMATEIEYVFYLQIF